jgi:hypothetical protein
MTDENETLQGQDQARSAETIRATREQQKEEALQEAITELKPHFVTREEYDYLVARISERLGGGHFKPTPPPVVKQPIGR